jgi:hypothetical protein
VSTPTAQPKAPLTLHLPRAALWILGLLLTLPWGVLLYLSGGHMHPQPAARAASPSEVTPGQFAVKPGPWGELYCSRILIEPPESLIPSSQPVARPTVWNFKGYTAASLAKFWQSVPLNDAERRSVADNRNAEILPDGILYRPAQEFVLGLSPEARAQIYAVLAAFPENPDQNDPYRFRAEAADEWFQHSELQAATIGLVKRLLYRRGTSLLFSDQNLVLPLIPSLQERILLLKTLARKSTLLVKLRVHADSDIAALDAYWSRGQRAKDIKPLLQSLVRDGTGALIDVIHLLPRVPRSLLYTYPSPSEPGSRTYLDCHWTVLNFLNTRPDDRYQDLAAVTAAFLNDYYPVAGKPTLGDIIMFAKPDGSIIHSCVFIAADIVYTKNGASPKAPWILMSLADVIAFYPSTESIDLQYYRAKPQEPATSLN